MKCHQRTYLQAEVCRCHELNPPGRRHFQSEDAGKRNRRVPTGRRETRRTRGERLPARPRRRECEGPIIAARSFNYYYSYSASFTHFTPCSHMRKRMKIGTHVRNCSRYSGLEARHWVWPRGFTAPPGKISRYRKKKFGVSYINEIWEADTSCRD